MDNLTHSLIGIVAAEAFTKKKVDPPPRLPVYVASILASNLPDLDFLWGGNLPPPLGTLLYHRGYTHIFLFCIPLALVAFTLVYFFLKNQIRHHKMLIFLVGLLGLVLHVAADSLNAYGVHPYYPFNNNWYYGDAVFIIEPLLWSIMGVYFFSLIKNIKLKSGLLLFLAIIPTIAFFMGYLKVYSIALIFALGAIMLALYKKFEKQKLFICIFAVIAISSFLIVNSRFIKHQIRVALEPLHTKVYDVVVLPYPSNPFCYYFLTIESDGQQYITRAGYVSKFLDLNQCPQRLYNFVLSPSQAQSTHLIHFIGEYRHSLDVIKKRKNENCSFETWLRFARVPVVLNDRAYDLRFSRIGNYGFSEIFLQSEPQLICKGYVPSWNYPRADLLKE